MMHLQEAALAIGGRCSGGDPLFSAVSTDTRADLGGKLFIALRGERFDAHDFLAQAAAQGAVAALVDERSDLVAPAGLPLLRVADTRLALGALAAHWRNKFVLPLIGVTGSNGKTTVKEMCAAILRAWLGGDAVLATEGNLNNDIGLPQMLLRLSASHRAAVIEMGMNHPGEIAYLAGLAKPSVAIVTNAQRAHLAGMGGLLAVAEEKGQIFEALSPEGVAIINADDEHAAYWLEQHGAAKVLGFGLTQPCDVTASLEARAFGSLLKLQTPQGEASFELPVPGVHNVRNALGAIAACLAAGAPLDACVRGLSCFTGAKGRLQRKDAPAGAILLDDTYNANPDSVRAGIDVLAATPGGKFLVLGDMGEIGEMSAQYHDEIGGYAKSAGVDRLFALGEQSALAANNFGPGAEHFTSVDELAAALRPLLAPDVVVLVKGSRFMRMERVVEALCSPREKD
ncbi:UDP-N-acetylmuramoyl-tripeptide--D-alanyl-D-alanine ligase [Uliginosibacterium sp. 31-12]|uniref:UDP-N-acetylmuramoyl-tripeptide--D-alanyl-D- alanine ligase n=1 Tax=Uliginosibacterium sp. 31-12 TaxID=3062781 RepID=UPI0026E3F7AA|nr:UDP-N-acetylmuramoyl-tripeptide--D-alanyl-D-alanine ligase [Uliginosibacterium sp. 31-12]MDO6387375.1 UDP-N-acetylmuramoyl-tripeptide--D-alanyl-D-alanine ligase [Uliginosibacterium sp. 31-12]